MWKRVGEIVDSLDSIATVRNTCHRREASLVKVVRQESALLAEGDEGDAREREETMRKLVVDLIFLVFSLDPEAQQFHSFHSRVQPSFIPNTEKPARHTHYNIRGTTLKAVHPFTTQHSWEDLKSGAPIHNIRGTTLKAVHPFTTFAGRP